MEPEVKTPPSRHYFYRKATQQLSPSVLLDGQESSNAFENRINDFIKKNALQTSMVKLRQDATNDLIRRKADRKARKEKEENKNTTDIPVQSNSTNSNNITPPNEQQTSILFEKPSSLNVSEQNAWLANIHDDAMLMNPHQWLKLASLFNVNSRASRQQSLLNISYLDNVLQDRNIDKDSVRPLETYMELRDIQNRNYARDAVAEGVKFIKQNRYKEAMDFYKRALDMDPKYAEGWFHVAEGLVHQRKLSEAEHHLDRVLKLDPSHEGAKALLASIRHTTKPKKVEKGDEWDIVDERGQSINNVTVVDEKEQLKETLKKRREEDESRRKKRSSRRSSRSRSPTRKSNSTRRRDRSKSPSRSSRRRDDSKSSRRSSRRRDDSKSPRRSSRRDGSKSPLLSSRRDESKSPHRSSRREENRSSRRDENRSSRRDNKRDDEDRSKRRDRRDDDKSSRYRHRSSSRNRKSRRDNDRKSSRRDEDRKSSSRRDDDNNYKKSSRRDEDDDDRRKSRRIEDDDRKSSSRRNDDKRNSRRDDRRTRDKSREDRVERKDSDINTDKVNNDTIENLDADHTEKPVDINVKDTVSDNNETTITADKANGTTKDTNGVKKDDKSTDSKK